ncbi:MAG: major capsid protein [Microviridae sp.]|nr:MAG: major capsid protein [Microviridae sp.]
MNQEFSSIQVKAPNKNVFDLSHEVKLSANMGWLIPTLRIHCLPGDMHSISNETLIRVAPMIAPMMHRVNLFFHCFFVPHRILWPNWEKFITNTKVGGILPAIPTITFNDAWYNGDKLSDYLQLPNPNGTTHEINAFIFAAYQKTYNEIYRDENLVTTGIWSGELIDGDNTAEPYLNVLRKRAWEHDYFTSCLPFAQKGDAVSIPIGSIQDDFPVRVRNSDYTAGPGLFENLNPPPIQMTIQTDSPDGGFSDEIFAKAAGIDLGATTINDFRTAETIQKWLELAARGGTRYAELLRNYFNIKVQDARLQRPEYIYGSKSPIQVSEVLQTSETSATPQGNMAGHGIGVQSGNTGRYYCHEHGYIIGMLSVMPKTAYQQGIDREFFYQQPLDFPWPQFAHLGEQAVLNKELKADHAAPNSTFGYNPRFSECKYMASKVAGDFKTTNDFWTMARIFGTDPALNANFINADPTFRIFAATDPDIDHLWIQHHNIIKSTRCLPTFSTPTI